MTRERGPVGSPGNPLVLTEGQRLDADGIRRAVYRQDAVQQRQAAVTLRELAALWNTYGMRDMGQGYLSGARECFTHAARCLARAVYLKAVAAWLDMRAGPLPKRAAGPSIVITLTGQDDGRDGEATKGDEAT